MIVHLDISQLLIDPRRTGIQRAERELIRHWPGPGTLQPCRFDPGTGELHELPRALLDRLGQDSPEGGVEAELARLAPLTRPGAVARPERLLCAELFSDPLRAAYYVRRAGRPGTYWLVYDFLPWLQPDWFNRGAPARLMPYLEALRGVPQVAFISPATKRDYVERIGRRASDGPVIPMGGDGLGLERQDFAPGRREFVMLGTIEPRKNAAPAMRAFETLWAEGVDARLTMIGTTSPDAPEELALLARLSGTARFRHLGHVNDEGVRACLRGARALLFPSVGEGYGIPPMEALHAGIPAIVSAELPALEGMPGLGQVRLESISADTIAASVRRLMDDEAAARLWAEAARMEVPGWAAFGRSVGAWVQAGG